MGWKPSADLVHVVASTWTRDWTYHRYGSVQLSAAIRASPTRTVVFALWHHSLLSLVGGFPAHGHLKVAALASLSGDGAIIANYLDRIGIRTVRGSSSRGAAQGAKAVLEALRDGYHVAIAVDGPRGPARQPKLGVLELARICGVPIVPVASRASRELRFRSWDRFRLPWPRAHLAWAFGAPLSFTQEFVPGAAVLAARQRQLATALDDLEASMATRIGARDRYPAGRLLDWRRTPMTGVDDPTSAL
jgi:lysophospholipid acyltransferase (LPLAT)-like uncharacterized protein